MHIKLADGMQAPAEHLNYQSHPEKYRDAIAFHPFLVAELDGFFRAVVKTRDAVVVQDRISTGGRKNIHRYNRSDYIGISVIQRHCMRFLSKSIMLLVASLVAGGPHVQNNRYGFHSFLLSFYSCGVGGPGSYTNTAS